VLHHENVQVESQRDYKDWGDHKKRFEAHRVVENWKRDGRFWRQQLNVWRPCQSDNTE
jgi:hypothetical protein